MALMPLLGHSTSLEALKSLLSTTGHWDDFAHLELQGAWENFTSLHTYAQGVGLLARYQGTGRTGVGTGPVPSTAICGPRAACGQDPRVHTQQLCSHWSLWRRHPAPSLA